MNSPKLSIVHTEWSTEFAGQENRVLLECREMMRRGHRVSIICQPEARLRDKAREAEIPVVPVPIRSPSDLTAMTSMTRCFRDARPAVVNTHSSKDSWVGSIAAKIARVPLLVRTRHISNPVRRYPWNLIWWLPDGYITTGEAIREHLVRKGIRADHVVSIPSGIDLPRFPASLDGSRIREALRIPPGVFLVSMIAALRSMKRHDVFLEAIRLFHGRSPSVHGLIVGDGPQRERVLVDAARRGITDRITMTGWRDDVPEILAASDTILLTSDRGEGVPQAILQAMAMARPVVASPVGGIAEVVIHGKTGLLCPVGDAQAYAEAMWQLAGDPALRENLGKAGRELVCSRYSVTAMGEQTEAFYVRMAEAKGIRLS